MPKLRRAHLRVVLGLALVAAGAIGLVASAWLLLRAPGATSPAAVRVHPWVEPGWGANVELMGRPADEVSRVLGLAADSGMTWARQHFHWTDIEPSPGDYRWEAADAILDGMGDHGMDLIAVLGTTPAWARPPGQEEAEWSPPAQFAAFGDFAARFAERYGERVTYYQIWDQPNIYPFWGDRYIDPEEYGRLLREAATRIRSVDDDAVIVLAGLAPNVEAGPLNLNEMDYLRRILRSGAGPFFDVAAAKAYGFEAGPEDRLEPALLNFRRVAMLRQVLVDQGRSHVPVWAVEFGWNALPDAWSGRPAPWGTDEADLQAGRSAEAVATARKEWAWMGPMLWARLLPPEDPDDPGYGFALFDRDLTPTALGQSLLPLLAEPGQPATGWHPPTSSEATYSAGWRVSEVGADPGGAGDWVEIRFWGTALDLSLRPGPYWAVWYVEVDGAASSALPTAGGRSYVVLHDPLGQDREVTVASGLPAGEHRVRITADGGWGQWPLAGWTSRNEPSGGPSPIALPVSAAFLVAGWLLARPERLAARLLPGPLRVTEALPEALLAGVTYGAGLLFWVSDGLLPSLAAGTVLAAAAVIAPQWVLSGALASLPFFLMPKRLLGFSLPVPEALAWLLLAGIAVRCLVGAAKGPSRPRFTVMDAAVAGLLLSAGLATLYAPLPGVAFHDLRRVLISAVALYAGARLLGGQALGPAVVGVLLGATAAGALGVAQYVRGEDLIRAGEVARVRALYGSPNNLALYLGRTLPLAAALVLFTRRWRLQAVAAAAAVVCLVAGVLTRSRGLVFLGIPAGVGILLWQWEPLRRRRLLLIPAAGAAILLVALTAGGRVEGLLTGTDSAATMRQHLWVSSAQMIQDRFWLGVGPDNFLYQYRTRYIQPAAWQEPDLSHPHNVLLDFWLTAGLGGVAALGVMVVWGTRDARLKSRATSGWQRTAYLGVSASLLAALAQGLVDNSLFLVDLSHLTLVYLALLTNAAALPPGAAGERVGPAAISHRGQVP